MRRPALSATPAESGLVAVGGEDHVSEAAPGDATGRKVLILSASMGAGHDGAAREIARRISEAGGRAEVRDFLESGPMRIGSALKSGYEFELRHVPSAYEATYRMWHKAPWLCPLVAWLVCALTRRRVLRWIRDLDADLVVSTYPLATLCLGRLRRTGRLKVPAVNFVTDFGVHPLWVHRGMDLNLTVHDGPAEMAADRTGMPSWACGPMVDSRFEPSSDLDRLRVKTRSELGLSAQDRAVLVVAGSWGIGDIEDTLRAVGGAESAVAIVVCGNDASLQSRVASVAARSGIRAIPLGWRTDMPALMAASDALVENAGGLTSFEAMRVGLPVVSFNPIAGHGRDNTAAMAAAGVSRLSSSVDELHYDLQVLCRPSEERDAQTFKAASMFKADGAAIALSTRPVNVASGKGAVRLAARAAVATGSAAALTWAVLTSGVAAAAAAGEGVAHPPMTAAPVSYLGARLDLAELQDPGVIAQVRALHASVVVDEKTAEAGPEVIKTLVASGISVVDGGFGLRYDADGSADHPNAPWTRAQSDVAAGAALGRLIGRPVRVFAPGRRITAFDLLDCRDAHLAVVVPNAVLDATTPRTLTTGAFRAHKVYILNGLGSTPQEMTVLLGQAAVALQTAQLDAAPLVQLR